MYLEGETIRTLVGKLPPHVFDEMVVEFPSLLEIAPWQTEYITWEPFTDDVLNADQVAEEYGYDNLENLENDYTVMQFEDGILLIQ